MGSGEHKRFVRSVAFILVGDITVFEKHVRIDLTGTERAVRTIEFILEGCFISQVYIKVTDAALISACQNRTQQVCADTRYVTAVGNTVRQPSGIFINQQMAADVIGSIFRISQYPYLRKIPLGTPGGIGVIQIMYRLAVFHGNLSDTAVVAGISSVHIARQPTP